MKKGHFEELYAQIVKGEKETKQLLLDFEVSYPGVAKETNVDSIAENLQRKSNLASVLAELRSKNTVNFPSEEQTELEYEPEL